MSGTQASIVVTTYPNLFLDFPSPETELNPNSDDGGSGASTPVLGRLLDGTLTPPTTAEALFVSKYILLYTDADTNTINYTLKDYEFQGTNAGTDNYTVEGDFNAIDGNTASISVLNVFGKSGIVDVNAGNGKTVAVGQGASLFNVHSAGAAGSTTTVFAETASVSYVGGTGTDEIIGGSGSMSIQGGTGGSLLVFGGTGTMNFVGGGESDTVVGGVGGETIAAGAGAVFAGTGGSTLSALGAQTYLVGNMTGDQVTASKAGGDLLVAGTGNETLNGGASGYANLMFGGTGGTDAVTLGHGNDTYVGGTSGTVLQMGAGNANVFLGAGAASTLDLVNGSTGGSDFVTNYRVGTDHIKASGYSANPTVSAAAGGTVLTFSDKTSITLGGVSSTSLGAILG